MKTTLATITILAYSVGLALSGVPFEVERLVEQRDRAIERVESTFIEELKKLQLSYAKNGDLVSVKEISAIIEANTKDLKPKPESEDPMDEYVGKWVRSDDKEVTLKKGGKLVDWEGRVRSWSLVPEGILISGEYLWVKKGSTFRNGDITMRKRPQ